MLSVYTRHHPDCAKKDDSNYRRCRCPKWLDGTLPGRTGRFRVSAKTKSWEQAELLARKYENSALSGEEMKPAKMPTVKEAVGIFLADAEARGLAPGYPAKTAQHLRGATRRLRRRIGRHLSAGIQFPQPHGVAADLEEREGTCAQKEVRARDRVLLVLRPAGLASGMRAGGKIGHRAPRERCFAAEQD